MQVFLTIDVEAHRVIDEISGVPEDSLEYLLSTLQAAGMTGTFFVDLCESRTWGQPFMRQVCERILAAKQDLQLHAHPHHFTKDTQRWQLGDYSAEEQGAVLDYALAEYVHITGTQPLAFRAGGFGVDRNTFAALKKRGLQLDCSLMYRWKGCKVDQKTIGVPDYVEGMRELPMTPVITLGTKSLPLRVSSIDFNWLPLFQIKRTLRRLRSQGAPAAVILLHSSSMLARTNAGDFTYKKRLERKFSDLLRFLHEESFATETIAGTIQDQRLWSKFHARPAIDVEPNPFLQYFILLYQSFVGQGFNRRFRVFLLLNILLAVGLLVLSMKAVL